MPSNKVKQAWQGVSILAIIYTAIYVPFKVAFLPNDIELPFLDWVDTIIDYIFVIDLFVNFFSAYEKSSDVVEYRCSRIVANYLKGWFFIDFIACFPFEML